MVMEHHFDLGNSVTKKLDMLNKHEMCQSFTAHNILLDSSNEMDSR